MTRLTTFTPVTVESLKRTAEIVGSGSAAAAAIQDYATRLSAGEMAACVTVVQKNSNTVIVFDARKPPDFLPSDLRQAYIKAAQEADQVLNLDIEVANTAVPGHH